MSRNQAASKKCSKIYSCEEAVEMAGHGRYQHLLLIACSIISNAVGQDMFGFSIIVAAARCDLRLGVTETGLLASVPFAGHGRYQHLLLIACSIISNAVGQDMFGFSIIVAAARCDLRLGVTETGLLASVPFAGVIFAFPWGYYADTRGRRRALLLSTLIGFFFAASSCLAPNWQLMMLAKVLASSFSSASYTLTMTLLGESTSSAHRGQYLFIMNSANLISESVAYGISYFLLPFEFSFYIPLLNIYFRPWRMLTLVMALPLGLGGLMMIYLQESPKFLVSRGENVKALRVLKSIYACNGGKMEYPVKHLATTEDAAMLKKTSFMESVVKQTVPIFKPPLLWRTLQLFYLMAICYSTNNTFIMWYATIVDIFFKSLAGDWNTENTFCQRVISPNSSIAHGVPHDVKHKCTDSLSTKTIISGILYGLFFCVVSLLIGRFARRKRLLLVFCLIVSGVSCLLVDLRRPEASLVFFVLLQVSIVAVPSLAAYCVDIYPTSCSSQYNELHTFVFLILSGLAIGLALMFSRLFSLAGVNLVGAVITTYCTMTFYAWSIFVFSGVVVSMFLPSDRKNRRQIPKNDDIII